MKLEGLPEETVGYYDDLLRESKSPYPALHPDDFFRAENLSQIECNLVDELLRLSGKPSTRDEIPEAVRKVIKMYRDIRDGNFNSPR